MIELKPCPWCANTRPLFRNSIMFHGVAGVEVVTCINKDCPLHELEFSVADWNRARVLPPWVMGLVRAAGQFANGMRITAPEGTDAHAIVAAYNAIPAAVREEGKS